MTYDTPFSGAINIKSVTKTGPDKFTVVCINGAHFFETYHWDLKEDERVESTATN